MSVNCFPVFGAYLDLSSEKVVVNKHIECFCVTCNKVAGSGAFCSVCGTNLTVELAKEQVVIDLNYIQYKLEKQGIDIVDVFYQTNHTNFIFSNRVGAHISLSPYTQSAEYNPQTHLIQVEYFTELAEPIFSIFDDLGFDRPVVKYGAVTCWS